MYLDKCAPSIQKERGSDQTFKVACRVGPGFDLPPDVTIRIISDEYNSAP